MMRKMLAILLTVILFVSIVAGCSNGSTESSNATGETTSEGTTEDNGSDKEGEYPVIRMNYAIVFDSFDEKAIEDELNKIMREKAGAEIDLIGIEFGNWSTQLNLMLTGGENSLDLFSSFWYTSVSNLKANGQVMALDDLLESDGHGIMSEYEGLEEYIDCGRVGGKLYGIPSIYAWCSEMLYLTTKEVSDAASIDWSQVNDLDTVTDALIDMKAASPASYFIPGSTDPYWIPKDIDYLGDTNFLGVLTDPTNSTTVENYYESEYFMNILEQVKIWKENDLISPDPLSNTNPTLMNLLMGVVDGTPGYHWDAQAGIRSNSVQNGLELVGTNLTEPLATTGDVTTYMWHISSFCENPDAAMRVLNVLYSDPTASQLITNGIEGLEYVINENGQMEYPEGKTMADIGWAAASMAYWPNVTICETWNYEDPDIYDQMKAKNQTANKSKALGFVFDSSPVADQMTACANVVAQFYLPLMYAETDIDTALPEFQAQLKSAGVDDIIAEKQSQLNSWLESK